MNGNVTLHFFDDAHLGNPELRAQMQKIRAVENEEYTQTYNRVTAAQRARVTVVNASGECLVGQSAAVKDALSASKSDAQIVRKFHGLTEDLLGANRVSAILELLWGLEDVKNVTAIPLDFVVD